jgi:hypothetical protein
MKTKNILTVAALAVLISASAALAEDTAPPVTGTGAPPAAAGNAEQKGEKFDERKAKILSRMSEHQAEFQKRQACVQAATDKDSLKACFPNRGHGGKGCKGGEGPGPEKD